MQEGKEIKKNEKKNNKGKKKKIEKIIEKYIPSCVVLRLPYFHLPIFK